MMMKQIANQLSVAFLAFVLLMLPTIGFWCAGAIAWDLPRIFSSQASKVDATGPAGWRAIAAAGRKQPGQLQHRRHPVRYPLLNQMP
jgi:hypothetical protein